MPDFDTAIIGAGVVGLAIAARLSDKHSGIVVLERNPKHGMETSSRNSEVIHAGIYYTPGSLKARLCVEGRDELYAVCRSNNIPHRQITKIITATNEDELARLGEIYRRGLENGARLELLDKEATLRLEPNVNTVGSIFSPMTGVVSAHALMDFFYHEALDGGATIQHRCEVVGIEKSDRCFTIRISENGTLTSFTSEKVINAAGLFADRIAEMAGIDVGKAGYAQVFAKGSYFVVRSSMAKIVSRLIYPVPLNEGAGVHALLDWGGRLKFGPDVEYLQNRTIDYGVSDSKRRVFGESIRRIVPGIADDDIAPDMAGIRPKLQCKGEPPKDFVIVHEKEKGLEGFVNLIGIESPGLTASPAIARYVESLLFL